jgi:endonuclease/exonuclease/phosphatase family metal-dependent hydrolase
MEVDDMNWIDHPVEAVVASLTKIPQAVREKMREGPFDAETHRRYFCSLQALGEIEVGGPYPVRATADGPIRVVAWNVERLRHIDPIADTMNRLGPCVSLLSEIDQGMARSGNSRGVLDLAERLGHAYAYGVEFVELDLGNELERDNHAGQQNVLGLHGNAVTANLRLYRPFLIRLEVNGDWFGWNRDEPRVGGRMAVGAQIDITGQRVTLVSVHLESHSDPSERATQTSRLLDLIDSYDATAPVLIGGDFNTSTFDKELDGTKSRASAIAADPKRLISVERYEPLFALMAQRGFDWRCCNDLSKPTQRPGVKHTSELLAKIDWFFTRSLRATDPTVVPALCPDGTPSSDHDCLTVIIAPGT